MNRYLSLLAFASLVGAAGCAASADVEKVPVGTEVEIVRADGGVVHGTITGLDERNVKVDVGKTSRTVAREQITQVRVVDMARPAPLPAVAKFREFTLPEGTALTLRLESAVASDTSRVEDAVDAVLTNTVMMDGVDVLPAGSIVHGEVAAADPSGKVKGRASLALRFTSITVAGRDDRISIAAHREYLAPATKAKDAAKIGIPAGAGAAIGGLLGGKKGAAIGAGVGGGAGTAVVLSTSGEEVTLGRGAMVTVELDQAADVRVPIEKPR